MLGSRRGRPSLIGRAAGTAARTAVITKTATAVAGSSASKQQAKMHAAELAHAQNMAAVGAPAGEAPAAPAPAADPLEAMRKLAAAHDAGILNDAEFVAKVKERLA
jgi:hypothetical protein